MIVFSLNTCLKILTGLKNTISKSIPTSVNCHAGVSGHIQLSGLFLTVSFATKSGTLSERTGPMSKNPDIGWSSRKKILNIERFEWRLGFSSCKKLEGKLKCDRLFPDATTRSMGPARRAVSAGEGLQNTLRRLLEHADSRENVYSPPFAVCKSSF